MGFLAFDGLTSTSQEQLFAAYDMSSCNQLLYVTLWSTATSGALLIGTRQMAPALAFVAAHPGCLLLIVAISIVSATVQVRLTATAKP